MQACFSKKWSVRRARHSPLLPLSPEQRPGHSVYALEWNWCTRVPARTRIEACQPKCNIPVGERNQQRDHSARDVIATDQQAHVQPQTKKAPLPLSVPRVLCDWT